MSGGHGAEPERAQGELQRLAQAANAVLNGADAQRCAHPTPRPVNASRLGSGTAEVTLAVQGPTWVTPLNAQIEPPSVIAANENDSSVPGCTSIVSEISTLWSLCCTSPSTSRQAGPPVEWPARKVNIAVAFETRQAELLGGWKTK